VAVAKRVPLDLVITSDPFALEFLEAQRPMTRRSPTIVLAGSDTKKEAYEGSGATALVAGNDTPRVIEAISELTGLAFRSYPRASLQTVVDVRVKDQSYFLYTSDLSASGVCIKDFPHAKYGDRATIQLDLFDPPLVAEAMVVRVYHRGDGHHTGLSLAGLSDADRARLSRFVEKEMRARPSPPSLELSAGERTMDLMAAVEVKEGWIDDYLAMLGGSAELPAWLAHVSTTMTGTERAAAKSGSPDWAAKGLRLRVELARRAISAEGRLDTKRIVRFCHGLAQATAKAERPEELVDATELRAALLQYLQSLVQG
jgi:hypothetical protein